jgi:hypothetical protein
MSVQAYGKCLFQSGGHIRQHGLNVSLARKLINVEEIDKRPVRYSHLQNEFHFRLPSTAQLH